MIQLRGLCRHGKIAVADLLWRWSTIISHFVPVNSSGHVAARVQLHTVEGHRTATRQATDGVGGGGGGSVCTSGTLIHVCQRTEAVPGPVPLHWRRRYQAAARAKLWGEEDVDQKLGCVL